MFLFYVTSYLRDTNVVMNVTYVYLRNIVKGNYLGENCQSSRSIDTSRGYGPIVNSWEICQRCAKILLAAEHKMQLA